MHNTHKPQSLVMQRYIEHIMRRAPRPLAEVLAAPDRMTGTGRSRQGGPAGAASR